MSFSRSLAVVALALALLGACAYKIQRGSEAATTGALRAAGAKISSVEPEMIAPLTEAGARASVQGAFAQLGEEETQRQLQQLVTLATEAALRGIAERERATLVGLSDDMAAGALNALAYGLEGPLGSGIANTTRTLSASAVAGARDELAGVFPECGDDDRRGCIERRITQLSHAASLGVASGVADGLKSGLLVVSFLVGAVVTLLAVLVMRGVERGRARAAT